MTSDIGPPGTQQLDAARDQGEPRPAAHLNDMQPILERIDTLEAELIHLRQQVATDVLRRGLPTEEVTVIECSAGGQHIGLLLDDVEEVLPVARLVPLPEAEPWILGTLNLRGESVVVFDLAHRLLGRTHVILAPELIVVCQAGWRRVGLLVEDVLAIESVAPELFHHPAPGVAFAPYLIGVVHEEHRSLPILEVERLVAEVTSSEGRDRHD